MGESKKHPYFKNLLIDLAYLYAKKKKMRFPSGMVKCYRNEEKYSIVKYYEMNSRIDETIEFVFHIAKSVDSEFFGSIKDLRIKENNFLMSDAFYEFTNNVCLGKFREL
jgi:hypothetical protein